MMLEPYDLVEPPEYLKYESQNQEQLITKNQEIQNNSILENLFNKSLLKYKKEKEESLPVLEQPNLDEDMFFDINFSNNDEHQGEYIFNNKKEFVNTLKPIIQQELINQNINPYFADSLIAQLALESAWGSKPTGKNNFAGLKSKDGKSVNTKEYINGKYVSIKDKFKNFESLEEFAKYYITKLKNKFKAFDGNDFVSNIRKHGYFTAPLNEYKRGFNLLLNNVRKLS